ncbi:MAG: 3D-(3,5/4)-trihydroxycyclohexane-1,2-dione acylhydrolase (decyclizing) [Alphaproteobacteria bacterium]|nr:3D-(3,5/4)-trihydroxycyclohexane-1,2-dione acylhydrolase (decyclizing) [Alphaproteobacteria bacterium]
MNRMGVRLTTAEALVRFLAAQKIVDTKGKTVPLFGGVFAIFGHGNVAGLGPALHAHRNVLPTLRAHNEQAMALAAVAYAKTHARNRMMACTTSIGPGATNMVTAAAVAHVNRLPVLLLPGDVFADRRPDPVLQQIENFGDAAVSANDAFRPVSRYWDRITRPEQILVSAPAALRVLLDPADCGPAVICLPQDVQAEAFDCPPEFFAERVHRIRRPQPDIDELAQTAAALKAAKKPMILVGGGVKFSGAERVLGDFAVKHGIPTADTQAGKGALAWDHPANAGALGVTGTGAANALAAEADVVLAVGTRLADFPTASRTVFRNPKLKLIQLNVGAFDAAKHGAMPFVADAREGVKALDAKLGRWKAPDAWTAKAARSVRAWNRVAAKAIAPQPGLPSDAAVLGVVNRVAMDHPHVMICAAGGLPGELHKLWRAKDSASYHLEYGFSCMGYEIAGGLGAKLAAPEREVYVLVGDGSYLMMNSEIATSVALGAKLTIVVLDNRGFGCIARLQAATGGAPFNNRLSDDHPPVDFAVHALALGAEATKVDDLAGLEDALRAAKRAKTTQVIVIDTDAKHSTGEGGAWWDVAVPDAPRTRRHRQTYLNKRRAQRRGA